MSSAKRVGFIHRRLAEALPLGDLRRHVCSKLKARFLDSAYFDSSEGHARKAGSVVENGGVLGAAL